MNDTVKIEKGEKYLTTAKSLSDIIKALPLNNEENQKLITGILTHMKAGRTEAYMQGVKDALTTDLSERIEKYLNEGNGVQNYS